MGYFKVLNEHTFSYTNNMVKNLMQIEGIKQKFDISVVPLSIEVKLKERAKLLSVRYSTAIEGNPLNTEQVEAVIKSHEEKFKKETEQEIKNYFKALNFLEKTMNSEEKISHTFLYKLHKIIVYNPFIKQEERYRLKQNSVIDSISGKIEYFPPEPKDVYVLMDDLIIFINKEMKEINYSIPVIAAISAYQMVTIHPFMDGNGRCARALATYILKKGGYDLKGFISMEEYYYKDLKKYYNSIQMNLHHNYYYGRNKTDLTSWIEYFITIMKEEFDNVWELTKKTNRLSTIKEPDIIRQLDKRARMVLGFLMGNNKIFRYDIQRLFALSERSAREYLEKLVKQNILLSKGESKKTRYYELTEKYKRILKIKSDAKSRKNN